MTDPIIKVLSQPFARRLGLWCSGVSAYYWGSWLYDYLFVSYILWKYGNYEGGIIVMFASVLLDLLTLKFYDWFKKDWLALETLKDTETGKGKFAKVIGWLHNKGSFMTILVLSVLTTPFIVTTFMRKGAHQYNGMSKRDVLVFTSSSLISNLYWIVIVGSGVSVVKFLYSFALSL